MKKFRPARSFSAAVLLVVAFSLSVPLSAQQPDAAPVDLSQMLEALRGIKQQQAQQSKSQKLRAAQEASAAASNPARAAELWEDAVRAKQFAGASKEAAQFREWKDNEGSVLQTKEVQNALRLHFNWLALTLQHSAGSTPRALLPAVIQHAKEAVAAKTAMEQFEENMKRDREQSQGARPGDRERERRNKDEAIRKVYNAIVNQPVNNSVVAQVMGLSDVVGGGRQQNRNGQRRGGEEQNAAAGGWEMSAGNYDGIYQSIILPELRAQKDPRLLEYWDVKLRMASEEAARNKLDFEADKFNTVTRPQLLWQRAQDLATLGQRNRAASEMFNLVKAYPTHPDAAAWVANLEQMLSQATTPAEAPMATTSDPNATSTPATP